VFVACRIKREAPPLAEWQAAQPGSVSVYLWHNVGVWEIFLYIINMYAVNAVYDGTKILAVEPISVEGCYEVVVTFLRKINSENDMKFCEQLSRNSLKDAWFPGDEDL